MVWMLRHMTNEISRNSDFNETLNEKIHNCNNYCKKVNFYQHSKYCDKTIKCAPTQIKLMDA
jgi:hypothetical protein